MYEVRGGVVDTRDEYVGVVEKRVCLPDSLVHSVYGEDDDRRRAFISDDQKVSYWPTGVAELFTYHSLTQ